MPNMQVLCPYKKQNYWTKIADLGIIFLKRSYLIHYSTRYCIHILWPFRLLWATLYMASEWCYQDINNTYKGIMKLYPKCDFQMRESLWKLYMEIENVWSSPHVEKHKNAKFHNVYLHILSKICKSLVAIVYLIKYIFGFVCLRWHGELVICCNYIHLVTSLNVRLYRAAGAPEHFEFGGAKPQRGRICWRSSERGEGVGYPPPTVGTFSKIRV